MKKISLAICFAALLAIGSFNVTKAGSVDMEGYVNMVSGLEKNVAKTSDLGSTTATAHPYGGADYLEIHVMENVPSLYRQHNDIQVLEGTSATTNYYSTAKHNEKLGLKIRVFARDFSFTSFPVSTTINYN